MARVTISDVNRQEKEERDLGEEMEKIEEGIENLKNKQFKIMGIKVTPMTVSAAVAGIGSVVGALYAGFVMYQKIEGIAGLDIEAFEQRMEIIETQQDEAIGYTKDIKNDLRSDILRIEKITEDTDRRVKEIQKNIDDSIREMEKLNREVEKDTRDTMRETEDRIDSKMEKLDTNLRKTLQEALDNPLTK